MTPSNRSSNLLKSEGYFVAVTERWNSFAHIRQDLFGFIDLLALRNDSLVAIQATTAANIHARLAKIRTLPAVSLWLASNSRRLEIHGWKKAGPRGKRKTWQVRKIHVTKELLETYV